MIDRINVSPGLSVSLYRPYQFDRVTITKDNKPYLCLLGVVGSEFKCGPHIWALADLAGALCGFGYYGLHSYRYLRFGYEEGIES